MSEIEFKQDFELKVMFKQMTVFTFRNNTEDPMTKKFIISVPSCHNKFSKLLDFLRKY
jgi:hypothetical protein